MRIYKLLGVLGIAASLSACSLGSPTYFGAKYPPTDSVLTYYSAKDVKKPYKVIGHMIAAITDSDQEFVKSKLIERAKKIGADALIFSDITRETHKDTTDDVSIKAEAVVFTEN